MTARPLVLPPPRPLDLTGLGECMVELRADGPLGHAPSLTRAWGGDVLNTLVGAARLGDRAAFVTRVGADPFGPALREAWAAEGLDLTQAPLVPGENGVYFISLRPGGEREFTYRRAGSAASGLGPEHIDPAHLASARAVLLSGITQAISPSAQAATLHAARLARASGTLVAYDPNCRPALWAARGGLHLARQAFAEVLPHVDVLLPSVPADLELVNQPTRGPAQDAAAFAHLAPLVAVKAGEYGAFVGGAGQPSVQAVAAPPVSSVVDTTGAGDAWNAGFLHVLLRGQDPVQAAQAAHRVASHSLGFRGALPPRPAAAHGQFSPDR